MTVSIIDALHALRPNAEWSLRENGLFWADSIQTPPTESEINAKIAELEAAEPMRLLRLERNRKLVETDWVTIKAYSQGAEVSAEWKTYLQALRDLPATANPQLDNVGNLTNVTWPEVPE